MALIEERLAALEGRAPVHSDLMQRIGQLEDAMTPVEQGVVRNRLMLERIIDHLGLPAVTTDDVDAVVDGLG